MPKAQLALRDYILIANFIVRGMLLLIVIYTHLLTTLRNRMIYSRIALVFLFSFPSLEVMAASQSNDLVRTEEQNVHAQAEEHIGTCGAMCLGDIPSWIQVLDVEEVETYRARRQQLTRILSSATSANQIEAIRAELAGVNESYQTALQKENAAEETMQKLSFKAFTKAFSLAQRLSEERLSKLNLRRTESAYSHLSLSDEERASLDNQIKLEEAQRLTLLKYLQLFSTPNAQQYKITPILLRAFLAEPGMITLYNQSMAPYVKQALLDEAEEVVLKCKHRFHKRCLTGLAKSRCFVTKRPEQISLTCPTCHAPLSKKDLASLSIEITLDDLLAFYENQRDGQGYQEIIPSLPTGNITAWYPGLGVI